MTKNTVIIADIRDVVAYISHAVGRVTENIGVT